MFKMNNNNNNEEEGGQKKEVVMVVHGGAGRILPCQYNAKMKCIKKAAIEGHRVLVQTDSPVDAVEAAIRVMEDSSICNAGYGSALTRMGKVEMDAMLIRGSDLKAGAVGAIKGVKNPITLAKTILEKTKQMDIHFGERAQRYARSQGLEMVTNANLVSPNSRMIHKIQLAKATKITKDLVAQGRIPTFDANRILDERNCRLGESVGAVAFNSKGEIAAGSSTGGTFGRRPGSVGYIPIVGAGIFCDDQICGISASGFGESVAKFGLASKIASLIDNGKSAAEACEEALGKMKERTGDGDGGAVLITKNGKVGAFTSSINMPWASVKDNTIRFGIYRGQKYFEENC